MAPSLSLAVASMVSEGGAVNVASSIGLRIDTSGGRLPVAATPQASTSMTRLELFSACVMNTRILFVVIGVNNACFQTRLLFVTAPPGSGTQADPSQYCISKA